MPARPRIVLLAARETGYRSLMRLNSRAFLETPPNEPPHLKLAWLAGETDGLIALTGGPGGPLDAAIVAGQGSLAGARCEALARLFGDRLYVELQRHGTARRAPRRAGADRARLCARACRWSPPTSRSSPPREDYEAHDALICIAEGRLIAETDRRQLTAEHRFKSRAEMAALFADLPEAIASTVEIAQRCAFRPRVQAPILPRFSVGEGGAAVDEAAELRKRAEAGLERRIKAHGVGARPHRRGLPRPARLRAQGDRRHEISRLLPHRLRLHPVGEGARHSGRARAAARAPARSSPTRSPSPISIRCASGCCSSASSIPSACRCPTSTSTSARTGATR